MSAPARSIWHLLRGGAVLILLWATGALRAEEPLILPPPPSTNYPFAKGPLESVDLSRKLITVRTKHGPYTYQLTERTYLFRGPDKISADQLKTGELIALRFSADARGSNLVVRLKAYPDAGSGGAVNSAPPSSIREAPASGGSP